MKTILFLSILLSVSLAVSETQGELTDSDLNKIRLIIKEEVDPIKKDVAVIQGQLQVIDKRFDDINKRIDYSNNLTYALIALIVVAVGIPQIIIASRWRKDLQLEKQVQGLLAEIETLKQHRIVQP